MAPGAWHKHGLATVSLTCPQAAKQCLRRGRPCLCPPPPNSGWAPPTVCPPVCAMRQRCWGARSKTTKILQLHENYMCLSTAQHSVIHYEAAPVAKAARETQARCRRTVQHSASAPIKPIFDSVSVAAPFDLLDFTWERLTIINGFSAERLF